jgi:lactoylglutathione lyase
MTERLYPLNHTDLFHVCHVVPDLEGAMAVFSEYFGVTWAPVNVESFLASVPGETPAAQHATTTWSRQGPVHIELGQIGAGPIRVPSDILSPHHCGYWCDEVETTRDGLVASGWTIEFEVGMRAEAPKVPFLRSAAGYGVELVSRTDRAALEAFIAR